MYERSCSREAARACRSGADLARVHGQLVTETEAVHRMCWAMPRVRDTGKPLERQRVSSSTKGSDTVLVRAVEARRCGLEAAGGSWLAYQAAVTAAERRRAVRRCALDEHLQRLLLPPIASYEADFAYVTHGIGDPATVAHSVVSSMRTLRLNEDQFVRREELMSALDALGLELRSDSAVCEQFIASMYGPSLAEVVGTVLRMHCLHNFCSTKGRFDAWRKESKIGYLSEYDLASLRREYEDALHAAFVADNVEGFTFDVPARYRNTNSRRSAYGGYYGGYGGYGRYGGRRSGIW